MNKDKISLCQSCNCMTKTIDGKCGKCGQSKQTSANCRGFEEEKELFIKEIQNERRMATTLVQQRLR